MALIMTVLLLMLAAERKPSAHFARRTLIWCSPPGGVCGHRDVLLHDHPLAVTLAIDIRYAKRSIERLASFVAPETCWTLREYAILPSESITRSFTSALIGPLNTSRKPCEDF
jgi:hypothetical protein